MLAVAMLGLGGLVALWWPGPVMPMAMGFVHPSSSLHHQQPQSQHRQHQQQRARAVRARSMLMAIGGDGPWNRRVCIIGGGAAGFMAAIHAGRGLQGLEGAEVVLLEGTRKVRKNAVNTGTDGSGRACINVDGMDETAPTRIETILNPAKML